MFYEMKFPDSISYKFQVINEFKTVITTFKNGKEQRNSIWDKCKNRFIINNDLLTKQEIEFISNFFNLTKGSFYGFRFKNWLDYKCTNQLIGIYDGEHNIFQLKKNYILKDFNNTSYNLITDIKKPVKDSVKIYINDIELSDYDINYSTGEITIDKDYLLENDLIIADFEFDYQVRFSCDSLKFEMTTTNLGRISNLELIEI